MIDGTPTPPDKFSELFSQQLESLRGISALIVLFSHCFQAFIAPFDQTIYSIIRLLGQSAVMVFFVLSGFLIGHSIQKNRQHFGQFNVGFYIRQRCKRILPPFIFAIVFTIGLYFLAPFFFASGTHFFEASFGIMIRYEYQITWLDTLGSALFLNGFLTPTINANPPLWSLSYEVWFYVLAGFFPVLLSRLRPVPIIGFTLLVGVLSWLNSQFLIYFLVWLFAFALSFRSIQTQLFSSLHPMKWFFMLSALGLAVFDFYQFHWLYEAKNYTTENFTLFNLCTGLALGCWLIQLQQGLQHYPPLWAKSADFSYTLYVTHFPLLLFMMGCFPQSLLYGLSGALLSLMVSMCSLILCAWILAKYLEPKRHIKP